MANPAALRRIVTERRVVQQADLRRRSLTPRWPRYAGARTLPAVPLLKQQELVGA